MTQSLVSIIIPTFRRKELLLEAVESVLLQSWPLVEILIIDDDNDKSIQPALEKLKEKQNRVADVYYLNRSDIRPNEKGAQVCRNIGLATAKGRFVLFLDDDDVLLKHCITNRIRQLEAHDDKDLCIGQCKIFEGDTQKPKDLWMEWKEGQDDLQLLLSNRIPWQTSGPLWKRSSIIKLGGWDESLLAGHDYEMHVRALANGLKYIRLNEVDYLWRAPRPDSYSGHERFKLLHSSGVLIEAFRAAIKVMSQAYAWKQPYITACAQDSVRLAMLCRLHGGTFQVAQSGLRCARQEGCLSIWAFAEATLCNIASVRLGTFIPGLSWASRRKLFVV